MVYDALVFIQEQPRKYISDEVQFKFLYYPTDKPFATKISCRESLCVAHYEFKRLKMP